MQNLIRSQEKDESMSHPHEDDDLFWQQLYQDIMFLDDVNGFQELEWQRVVAARKLEIQLF